MSRLSTTAFRGRDASLEEISAHLGADYVLSGAYRAGDDARSSSTSSWRRPRPGDPLGREPGRQISPASSSGEQELIGRLIAAVSAAVTTREVQRSRSQPLPTLKAYTLLMGAVSLMHRLSLPDFEEAHRLLQTLIDRGVRHPLPIAWLGNWHVLRVQQGWSDDPQRDTYLALGMHQARARHGSRQFAGARDQRLRARQPPEEVRHRRGLLRARARRQSEQRLRLAAQGHAARLQERGRAGGRAHRAGADALAARSASLLLRFARRHRRRRRRPLRARARAGAALAARQPQAHLDLARP